ncbi:SRPBCC family protein [Streptomyces sp. NPDC058289]|uniref:SRPBCC family protein n=1 Tax=Streptomyces sp. NPDC058289 TaxID=3346425 RepID=UPI0036E3A7C2
MVKESIDIDVPVGSVYNQWTQFEEFPRFMEGVEAVQGLHRGTRPGERRLAWAGRPHGRRRT